MKSPSFTKLLLAAFASTALVCCKNPNATQETDGQTPSRVTTQEIDSSSIQKPGDTVPSNVPKDMEGSNTSNN